MCWKKVPLKLLLVDACSVFYLVRTCNTGLLVFVRVCVCFTLYVFMCQIVRFTWTNILQYVVKRYSLRGCLGLPACLHTCLPFCLSACITFCLSTWLSVCLHTCLPVCLPAYLSTCLSVCLHTCLPARLSACQSACLPAHPSACLSACIAVCLSAWIPVGLSVCLHTKCTYLSVCLPAYPPLSLTKFGQYRFKILYHSNQGLRTPQIARPEKIDPCFLLVDMNC